MPKSKEYISDSDEDGEKPKKKQKTAEGGSASASSKNQDIKISLGKNKFVTVSAYKGTSYVNIREYYDDNGVSKPGKKGIALTQEQWAKLKMCSDDIDAELKKL